MYNMTEGRLCVNTSEQMMGVIDVPELAGRGITQEQIVAAATNAVEHGASGVCVTLSGFTADGTSISPDAVAGFKTVIQCCGWRSMSIVCRIFGKDAPVDPAYRLEAVSSVAQLVKMEHRSVYWIEGSNCEELVAEFKKEAPGLIVLAEKGGDIPTVSTLPVETPDRQLFYTAGIPPKGLMEKVHFLLPNTEESLTQLDSVLQVPQSEPFTPDNAMLTKEELADGWVSLFDGKGLNGWWVRGNQTTFHVEEGGVIGCRGAGSTGLYTNERYGNFALRLDFKIVEGGNCGIHLRAPRAARASAFGMEFQIQDDYGKPPTVHTAGAIYLQVAPKVNAIKKAGEWNTMEVILDGQHFKGWMNGELVQDANLDDYPELKTRIKKGFIGLTDHTGAAWYRNVRIKKL
jgi:hypothetical protein